MSNDNKQQRRNDYEYAGHVLKEAKMNVNVSIKMLRRFICFICLLGLIDLGFSAETDKLGHWIAITPSGLRTAIEPLCEHRRQEGFDVLVVEAEEIYKSKDESLGKSKAIRDYLRSKYANTDGPIYVLLVGAARLSDQSGECTLPTVTGQIGRMKTKPCDLRYVIDEDIKSPKAVLGRLPGRNPEEIEHMVDKILRYEKSSPAGPWKYRLSIMVGNPGGRTWIEKAFSGPFVQMMGQDWLSRIDPFWCVDGFIHVAGSEFYVPNDQLPSRAKSLLEEGQVFSFYLGHSTPGFLGLDDVKFLHRKDWENLKISNLPGVFFTCGCYAAQFTKSERHDGYAFAAMRNPKGPVAVICAFGESYGAIGQLAFGGMLECLSRARPPKRLGDYWLSVQKGIAQGQMEPMMFKLFDTVDGSRGSTTLDFQRLEHLEMWMLLGDPATRIPLPSPDVKLTVSKKNDSGETIKIKGTVPAQFEGGIAQLTLERTLRKPKELSVSSDENKSASTAAWMGVIDYANGAYILDKTEVKVEKGGFSGNLKFPKIASPAEIIVRAYVTNGSQSAMNIEVLESH
ncbi:MAG: C25 family cysteine peptidase [Planctomycetota bacterium]